MPTDRQIAILHPVTLWSGPKQHDVKVEAGFRLASPLKTSTELLRIALTDEGLWPVHRSNGLRPALTKCDSGISRLTTSILRQPVVWEDAAGLERPVIQEKINNVLAGVGIECTDLRITTPSAYTLPKGWFLVKDHLGRVMYRNPDTGEEQDVRPT